MSSTIILFVKSSFLTRDFKEFCKFTSNLRAMNLKKKKLFLIEAILIATLGTVLGQSAYDLNFQGMLADIQGNNIKNEQFDLSVQLKPESGQEILFEFNSSISTDENGWFGFTISEISRYLLKGGEISETLVIRLEFLPNAGTKWMRKGDDFMVTYTLAPSKDDNSTQLKITRMEGTELVAHTEDHLYAFKDLYPFAYLTGGFVMTDQPPVSEQTIAEFQQWVSPDNQNEEGAASRGVKGGFPAGGYYKKK